MSVVSHSPEVEPFVLTHPAARSEREPAFRTQLLKWVGNKQRRADAIISYFPADFGTYFEPFVGSGGVLGVLAPKKAVASDIFAPLVEIWTTLKSDKDLLKKQYADRYNMMLKIGKQDAYRLILKSFNKKPNGADLVFLCRACYGGVVRFRKNDGHMSTPVGTHSPVSPEGFAKRVEMWHERTAGTSFKRLDFAEAMRGAHKGDLVYCDPPYVDSQTILYGAQAFSIQRLFKSIESCKKRGVRVALSIDGTKLSGRKVCDVPIPSGLFAREELVDVGRSMLKRFQMDGKSLAAYRVQDRLLLTY